MRTPCLAKLDALDWPAGIVADTYGARYGIRCSTQAGLDAVRAILPPGTLECSQPSVECLFSVIAGDDEPRRGARRLSLAYQEHVRLARERTLSAALRRLVPFIRLRVAEHARARVFVHAGVVAWEGRAIVIPGRSFSGKSTLVAELLRHGASYMSDEYALLDGSGRVHPFAKPLSLRATGEHAAVDHPVALQSVDPLPAGAIVSAPFQPGARWHPARATAATGALALLANSPGARRDPVRVMSAVRRAAHGALVLEGARGEAAAMANELLDRLTDHPERR